MKQGTMVTLLVAFGLAAVVASSGLDWNSFQQTLGPGHLGGLGAFLALAILTERLAIPLVGGREGTEELGTYSIVFLLVFSGVLVLGPVGALIIAAVSNSVSEFVLRKKDPIVAAFNVAQISLAAAAAGLAYTALGGTWNPNEFAVSAPAFLCYVGVYGLFNVGAATVWIAATQRKSVREVATKLMGPWGANLLYDFLVTPVAALIAFFYVQFWIWGLVGVLFVLLWIRRSYTVNHQLQQANRDLLKALVKAIETRDPYTSGHSVRVASLAGQVARELSLNGRDIENIETAALLHDVGKIEAIYSDILKKKGGLTDEEMEIIKSHVDKGVELLTSLSSFHSDVIAAVRHHHERYDGSGYPDGVAGLDIPLGARIIKICDAVDAMLSDRPYRKALALPDVREQLMLFAEREFDPTLVSLFFRAEFLEQHAEAIRQGDLPPAPTIANPKPDGGRRSSRVPVHG